MCVSRLREGKIFLILLAHPLPSNPTWYDCAYFHVFFCVCLYCYFLYSTENIIPNFKTNLFLSHCHWINELQSWKKSLRLSSLTHLWRDMTFVFCLKTSNEKKALLPKDNPFQFWIVLFIRMLFPSIKMQFPSLWLLLITQFFPHGSSRTEQCNPNSLWWSFR